jgi:hypothetical protein
MYARRKVLLLLLAGLVSVISVSVSGCALLPYSSNYGCPESKADMGDCSSLITNYKESLHPKLLARRLNAKKNINCPVSLRWTKDCAEYGVSKKISLNSGKISSVSGITSMRLLLYKKLFQKNTPPLRIPAIVKKALILPYSGKKVFHGMTEIYFVTQKGKWLLGNYLYKNYKKKGNMFTIVR